ncbi:MULTISPECIES: OmpA/MotB family protein [Marinobacter]|uniref:OmpA/MotB family protein n=1 Tax=Marinobacter TaxID=2742 RepID=UPI000AF36C9B|nr:MULTISPECIES: OmpA family protein [unclassified Marinobacter]
MALLRTTKSSSVDEENPYWMSFSDIMSGLLVIFILASVILILQLMELQEQAEQEKERLQEQVVEVEEEISLLRKAEEVRKNILTEAAQILQERGIQVEVSENSTVLRIPNQLLGFDSGDDEIGQQYRNTAYEIGEVLHQLISKEDRSQYLDTVFVEGHTDSVPFNARPCGVKGNWCLSTFRAISLWQLWEQVLPEAQKLGGLENGAGKPLFSVSGYAETRPVVENQQTEDDYRQNRRIDIRFTIRRPSSEDYEKVRDKVKLTQ